MYCKNLNNIAAECNSPVETISCSIVKDNLRFYITPVNEFWRIDMLLNLISVRNENLFVEEFNHDEITEMINYVCTT